MAPDPRGGRRTSRARAPARSRAGLTLLELMIVVAILAILGGIATPIYVRYLYRAKASEAVAVLGQIQLRQEAWRALPAKQYCDVSPNADAWFPSANPGSNTQLWPNDPGWQRLFGKRSPKGYGTTYFSYVVVADSFGVLPAARGFSNDRGMVANDNWYIARALGDLNGDEAIPDSPKNITFEFSSESRKIWVSNPEGWQ